MVKVRICAVGKIKEIYLRDAIAEYDRRIRSFCQVDCFEYPEISSDNNQGSREKAIEREGERLLSTCCADDYVIALDPGGRQFSSESFSRILQRCEMSGPYQVVFLIGGPLGLSESCRKQADITLSLSSMTFTHQIARLLLYEQIYRAFTIIRSLPYHR